MSKVEDHEKSPSNEKYPRHSGDNVGSSTESRIRSSFIRMGFSPALVDRAIKENGEDNDELLLETLFTYSALQTEEHKSSDLLVELPSDKDVQTTVCHQMEAPHKTCSVSSDSLDSLFGDKKDSSSRTNFSTDIKLKEEPDVFSGDNAEKKSSLLMMNFSVEEVEFAINKLGEDASVNELVDFIFAAQIAERPEKYVDSANYTDEGRSEYLSTSSSVQCSKLVKKSRFLDEVTRQGSQHLSSEEITVKTEGYSTESSSQFRNLGLMEKQKVKRPKEAYIDKPASWKRLKEEYSNNVSSVYPMKPEAKPRISKNTSLQIPTLPKPNSCRSLDQMVAKPPYFFYGNVANLSRNSWIKVSQFLYAVEPEFVHTQFYSALSRKEGYVHNLPTENRFHIKPKSPMTIQNAIPEARKWWPFWDTRKQLSCINADITRTCQQRDMLERILIDCKGSPSVEQQRDLLYRCQSFNLVWAGGDKLKPMDPEHLECILGYPAEHTQAAGISLTERLQSLEHCFQTDTLGYHVSVLKSMFRKGLTLLSIYSGIGGSEIALHRLGIRLKGAVSVEPCEIKRRILKRWWNSSGQSGELVQIENIQKLTSSKIEMLINKFGGFDFIICQNPCSYSSKCHGMNADVENLEGLEFTLFCEFVRMLHRVRGMMGCKT